MKSWGLFFLLSFFAQSACADTITLKVKGLLCFSCALTIKRKIHELGTHSIKMTFSTRTYVFRSDASVTNAMITTAVTSTGFAVESLGRVVN